MNTDPVVIGIDPGKSGGVAIVSRDRAEAVKLDGTERDVYDAVALACMRADFAYIERVSAWPGQGVASSFRFGQSYGFLRGVLVACRVPFDQVTPAKWQRNLGCLSKGDKNVTKAKAQELWPELRITHAIADALLIAEYGRRRVLSDRVLGA